MTDELQNGGSFEWRELSLRFGEWVWDGGDDRSERIEIELSGLHLEDETSNEAYHVHFRSYLSRDVAQNLWLALNTVLNWKNL